MNQVINVVMQTPQPDEIPEIPTTGLKDCIEGTVPLSTTGS
jgi:hypothetical protein